MAGVLHFLPCVGTSMEPAPAAISGHGASVIAKLKCPCGQVGAVRRVQTTCWDTEGEAEERDRQCKKRRRQRHLRPHRVQGQRKQSSRLLPAQSPRSSRPRLKTTRVRPCFFRRSAVLRDICAGRYSRRALFNNGVSGSILPRTSFLLEEETATMRAPSPSQPFYKSTRCSNLVSSTKTIKDKKSTRLKDQGITRRYGVFFEQQIT